MLFIYLVKRTLTLYNIREHSCFILCCYVFKDFTGLAKLCRMPLTAQQIKDKIISNTSSFQSITHALE